MEKNWICCNVRPALFSKVTWFSPEVLCSVGLKYLKYMDSAVSFEGDNKKGRQLFEKKVHLRSFCAPSPPAPLPHNVKSWLCAWHQAKLGLFYLCS